MLLRSWLRVVAANNFCNILIHMIGVPATSVAGTFFYWEGRHSCLPRGTLECFINHGCPPIFTDDFFYGRNCSLAASVGRAV